MEIQPEECEHCHVENSLHEQQPNGSYKEVWRTTAVPGPAAPKQGDTMNDNQLWTGFAVFVVIILAIFWAMNSYASV
jgi:hypothetical protein